MQKICRNLVSLNRADVLISELMKEFHSLQSSEQNLYKELATLDSFKRSSEATLNDMKRKVLRIWSNYNFSRQVLEDQSTNERFLQQTTEATLNWKIEEYRAHSDVEHRLYQQIADLKVSCEVSETSLRNENKKLR